MEPIAASTSAATATGRHPEEDDCWLPGPDFSAACQQDGKDNQNGNRADIDQQLGEPDKFRVELQVDRRQPAKAPAAHKAQCTRLRSIMAATANASVKRRSSIKCDFIQHKYIASGGNGPRKLPAQPDIRQREKPRTAASEPAARREIPHRAVQYQAAATSRLISASGTRNFQAKFSSWSRRKRGSVARTQMNRKISAPNFAANQSQDGTHSSHWNRRLPSAQKQRHGQPGHREQPEVFPQEKQGVFEPGILRQKAGDDFRFSLPAGQTGNGWIPRRRDEKKRNPARPQGVKTFQRGNPQPKCKPDCAWPQYPAATANRPASTPARWPAPAALRS
jgi:hypothetical protein